MTQVAQDKEQPPGFHSLVLDDLEGWSCSAPSCDWYVIDIADEEIVRSIWSDEHTHGEETAS